MRFIVRTGKGRVELNYMWLPTWIGMNSSLVAELEKEISPKVQGKALTPEVLDQANAEIIEFLVEKCPLPGLSDYLDGIKFIVEQDEERTDTHQVGGGAG